MAKATDLPWESHVTFKACADFMESVSREEDRKRRVSKLARFLTECRKVLGDFGRKTDPADPDDVDSLYPVMRLFLPAIDRERGSYGIKETVLAKVLYD